MKTLHLDIHDHDGITTRMFSRFPVRIGREPANELLLDHPFISRTHARLDVAGHRLLLRDEGSRNVTFVPGTPDPLHAGEVVALDDGGHEFRLGTLRVVARLVEDLPAHPPCDGTSTDDHTTPYDEGGVDPAALDAAAVRLEQGPLAAAW